MNRPSVEPTPPLRAALDIALRFDLEPPIDALIAKLSETVRTTSGDADWRPVYDEAIAVVERAVEMVSTRLEATKAEALAVEEPALIKQRIVAEPKKGFERVRGDLRTRLQDVARRWAERSKRQQEHVLENCQQAVEAGLSLSEQPTAHGIDLTIDPTWWAQFGGHVVRCCDEWTRVTCQGADAEFQSTYEQCVLGTADAGKAERPKPPATLPEPRNEGSLAMVGLPVHQAEVPSMGGALMHSMRSNVMTIGIAGTMFVAVFALVGQLIGSGGGTGPNRTMVRGGLLLAALPVSAFFGWRSAKHQRSAMLRKATQSQEKNAKSFIRTELGKALDRHRRALERWLQDRQNDWTSVADAWWDAVAEPALQAREEEALAVIREQKLVAARLSDDVSNLRRTRDDLAGRLLFDLKRRRRELG